MAAGKFETIRGLLEGFASSNVSVEDLAGGVEEQEWQATQNYFDAIMAVADGETLRDVKGAFRLFRKAKFGENF